MGLFNWLFRNKLRAIISEELSMTYEIKEPLIGFVEPLEDEYEDEEFDE